MKKLLFFIALIITAGCSQAQKNDISKIPPYRILTSDSVYVTPAKLKKNKPVAIIYFSPDCGHCQQLVYELKPKMKQISNVQLVFITFTSYKMIKGFVKDFGLSAYPNITVGTEGYTYVVQRYYQVKNTPFIAIYDSKGKLSKTYEKVPKDIDELIAAFKKA